MGTVLHQEEGPVAFFSRPMAPRHVGLAAYERELIALAQVVKHWRPYLWGRSFVVKTDHYSLKFLLDQHLSTIPQHRWISKLMGFDFVVEYKPGKANIVADALSRRDADDVEANAFSTPSFDLWREMRLQLQQHHEYQEVLEAVTAGRKGPEWVLTGGFITKERRVFVPASTPIVQLLLEHAHAAGHEGVQRTLHRLRNDILIAGDKALVQEFVRDCAVCQQNKTSHLQPSGLLQPLPVPTMIWSDLAMDFIEALSRVNNKTVTLTVVYRLSKAAHFIPLGHPYTATSVARAFFDEVVRLHGFPTSIVSDRDPVFTSTLWKELFRLLGTQLNLSSAFHPQSDGQSEVANKVIVMYLRCLTGDRPKQWLRWLPWAEYCFNTAFHSALRTTPFKLVYGRDPPSLVGYEKGDARAPAVDQMLRERDEFLQDARDRLHQAQEQVKLFYDAKHTDMAFSVGDWVWVKLLQRPVASMPTQTKGKLAPRFYRPYQILERIGDVAYRLHLPAGARIHNVFHVGVLKAYNGAPPAEVPPLPQMLHGRVLPTPTAVLKSRLARGRWQVLVRWEAQPPSECRKMLKSSELAIRCSSSRTSSFRRRGEMSWPAGSILVGDA
jgi:hypothetical protein